MKKILDLARKYEQDMVQNRRYFHENAESGFELELTTKRIVKKLTEMGYTPKVIGNSGIMAIVGGKKPGKTFLIRGDMDALPMKEETNEPFKSKTDNMHACGHDFHASMLLGAANILKDLEDEIDGTVKLMFQPAEELLCGAKTMVDDGILKNPDVDAALMIHIMSGFPIKTGKSLFFAPGPIMASHDRFEINIKGKGCHGAMASTGIDPLMALSNIHLGIQAINSREIAAGEFLVVTVGHLGGGTTANIIPDTAFMTGTIRTYSPEIRDLAKNRISEIADNIGTAFRCKVEVKYHSSCPTLINNPELREDAMRYTKELLSEDMTLDLTEIGHGQLSGSEDFAFVSEHVPTTMISLASSIEGEDVFPMHHPKVKFDESVLYTGAAIHVNCAMNWLKENK